MAPGAGRLDVEPSGACPDSTNCSGAAGVVTVWSVCTELGSAASACGHCWAVWPDSGAVAMALGAKLL
eukprot:5362239-Amphidinium_carterae.3